MKKKALRKSKSQSNQKYKDLTNFLFNIDDAKMAKFIASFTQQELNNFKFRVFNQVSGNVRLAWYLNKYMNNLYEWQTITFQDFMYTVNKLLKMSGIENQSSLRFSKYQVVARNDIYSILSKYFKQVHTDKEYNNNDMVCLFKLYETGAISDADIEYMKTATEPTSEGKAKREPKKKATANTMFNTAKPIENIAADASKIIEYKNNILGFIKNRASCNTCPLQKNGFLLVTTNSQHPQNVDILFISEGASANEIAEQEHMTGMTVKNNLIQICQQFDLKYAFINLAMCDLDSASTNAKKKQAFQTCRGIFDELKKTFSAKINVLFGDNVRLSMGIKGDKSSKIHATKVMNNIISINADRLNKKHETELYSTMAETFKSTKFEDTKESDPVAQLDNGRMLSRITPDLTLFDIKEISSKILYILINKQGEKVYYIEDMQMPIYVKPGSMAECDYIIDNAGTDTVILNKQELQAIKKETRSNMSRKINL